MTGQQPTHTPATPAESDHTGHPDGGPHSGTQPLVYTVDVPMAIRLKSGRLRPMTHNDRLHWRAHATKVRKIRQAVHLRAREQNIPAAAHLTVTLHYRTGGRSVTDPPNLTATSKPAIDGLIDAGLVPDDTPNHVTEHMPVIHNDPSERQAWLEIAIEED